MSAFDTIKSAVLGNPVDPNKQPSRVGVVKAFAEMQAQLEGAQAGALVFDTFAALPTGAVPSANIMAWVMNGSQAGIYQNTGTALAPTWTRRGDIPQFSIAGINVGAGTANAIQVTTDRPVPTQDGRALIIVPVLAANTVSPPTVSINGGVALPIVTNSGNNVVVGGIAAGMYLAGFVSDGKFRLLSDQASAAIVAAAEGYANIAQAAAANNLSFITKTAASAATIDPSIHSITLKGFNNESDGLGGQWTDDATKGYVDSFTTNGGARTWYRAPFSTVNANVVLTVGAGGQFTTLNAAIAAASKLMLRQYVYNGFTVEVKLLTGFILNEQVIIKNIDLSFITITSVDAVVYINAAGITQQLNGTDDAGTPVFGAMNSAKLPRIGVQFEFQTQQTSTKQGVAVFGGSSVEFLPGSGVRKSARGLAVYHSSEAFCNIPGYRSVDNALPGVYSVDFSNAYGRGLDVQHSSRVCLPRSKFNDCGGANDIAVYGIWGCYLDLTQAKVRNAKGTDSGGAAVRIRDGSHLCMREGDVSYSLSHGIYASHGAFVDFRQKAGGGVTLSEGAKNCTLSAIYADGAVMVECAELVATGCRTAGAGGAAIYANSGAIIAAASCDVSNSGDAGFRAQYGSIINAQNSIANDCAGNALYTNGNGQINFNAGSALRSGSIAIYADQGSSIEAAGAVTTGYVTYGACARRGARLCLRSANLRKVAGSDANTDIQCQQGAIIEATDSTGGIGTNTGSIVAKTPNTVDGNGLVFK